MTRSFTCPAVPRRPEGPCPQFGDRVSPSAGWGSLGHQHRQCVPAGGKRDRRGEIFDEVRPADDDRQSIDLDVDAAAMAEQIRTTLTKDIIW